MAFKEFTLNETQTVKVYKRRSSRSLRLSITATGQIRVTIPLWAPYRMGIEFARSKQSWLHDHHITPDYLQENQPVGKAHRLHFTVAENSTKPSSRIKGSEIIITYPKNLTIQDEQVQIIAQTASKRALKKQADSLLPQRLHSLSKQHGFEFKSVSSRQLKSRWGSCDQHKHIVLNIFLLQLPWDLIDYVLLHELTHTQVLHHGPDFWKVLNAVLPNAKKYRKEIKKYQPILNSAQDQSMA